MAGLIVGCVTGDGHSSHYTKCLTIHDAGLQVISVTALEVALAARRPEKPEKAVIIIDCYYELLLT